GTNAVFDFGGGSEFSELALFGELYFMTLNDRLQLTLGGRVFRSKADTIALDGSTAASSKEDNNILKASASWSASDSSMFYAQVSQGYRSGAGNTDIPDPPANFDTQFGADTLTNYELGYKGTLFDGKLQANASVYYIDWQDIQSQFTTDGGFLYGGNGGSAHTQGVELEFTATPISSLMISGSVAYLEAELDEDVPEADLIDGQRLPGTPEWTASLNVRSQHNVSNSLTLTPSALITYRDESFAGFGVDQDEVLDAYTRVNLYLELASNDGDWSVTLTGENVTGETPIVQTYGFRTVRQFVTIRPRTWGFAFRKSF
ncbi:MAG: TonB-dependent receptor, partial [Pseudomonadales bacterium]